MAISKDQMVHELAMACVNGMIMSRVMQESKDDETNIGVSYDGGDLALDALLAYKQASDVISVSIDDD